MFLRMEGGWLDCFCTYSGMFPSQKFTEYTEAMRERISFQFKMFSSKSFAFYLQQYYETCENMILLQSLLYVTNCPLNSEVQYLNLLRNFVELSNKFPRNSSYNLVEVLVWHEAKISVYPHIFL